MVVHQGIQQYEEERFLYAIEGEDKLFQLADLQQKQIKLNKKHITLTNGIPCKMLLDVILLNLEFTFVIEMSSRVFRNISCLQKSMISKKKKFIYILHLKSKFQWWFFQYFVCRVDQKSKISNQCFIGQNSEVKSKVMIIKSIIGKNCNLRVGCEIINSILWYVIDVDGNIVIRDSIIASERKIKNSIQSQIVTIENQRNVRKLSILKKYDENTFESEISDEESDSHEPHQKKPKKNLDQGLKEDMIPLVANCQNISQVKQAIINVDTIKVNSNIAFENIVKAFMPAFLATLQPDLKSAYVLWEEFILRLVSETKVVCYIKQIEQFCRQNKSYHLNQFLQLSYKHQILSEQVILNYQNQMAQAEGDQFAADFIQASQQFTEQLENIITEQEQQQTHEEQGDGEYEYKYVYK